MYIPIEIIVLFFLISFLIYTMPMVLVKFSRTLNGKIILLTATILMTLYNRTGGLLIAMLMVFLSEFNYEFVNNHEFIEGYTDFSDIIGDTGSTLTTPGVSVKKKMEKIVVEEKLQPVDSSTLKPSQ